MDSEMPPAGRVSGQRLRSLLGAWRGQGSRRAAAELAAGIRRLAVDGRLPAGTRLPAERELAGSLAVSRTMVGRALEALREDGVIASRRGSGSWIVPTGGRQPVERAAGGELIELARASPPALPCIPDAVNAAALRLPEHLGGHGYSPRGLPELRELIAARYAARGLPTTAEQILVTGGAHDAFVTLLATFTNPGDRVLVEQPTYFNTLEAIRSAHALAVPVPMRADGWSVDELAAALRQSAPSLAYLLPEFQNPTGHRMEPDTRALVAGQLRRHRTPVVVDETLIELDYADVAPPPPFACFADDYVITVGSTSKSHWGGLRVGWLRAPHAMIERLLATRSSLDLGSPIFEQLVLIELLGLPQSVLDERRVKHKARRDVLVDALHESCPQWKFRIPGGGLSLWCELDAPISTRLSVAAESFGIRIAPGARFSVHGGLERMIRVPFVLPENELREAARLLGGAAASVSGKSDVDPLMAHGLIS